MNSGMRIEVRDGHIAVGRGRDEGARVIFFPHAGGSAISMLPLASDLHDGVEALLIDLPGRGARDREPRAATFDEARRVLARQVEPLLDRPAIMFGHSLGGLLCDAVVRSLSPRTRAWLRCVVVSSAPSPRRTAALSGALPSPPPRRSRERLVAGLIGYGGTPAPVFDTPELLEGAVKAFGDDLLIMDSYQLYPCSPLPETDYELWNGGQDASAASDEPEAWADVLVRPPRTRMFPGGHFYLLERSEARECLHRVVKARLWQHDQEASR
ncbi:thioesterase II family protein [Streptosporangium roseum]|uniref:thioesterase II family protein n=1 Tax=Streptosporangium roseum TaxID=2001 RepID=UPI003328440D